MQNAGFHERRIAGFTLVELMIVLAILAALAALAWPTYQNAVQRSRRADAVSALLNLGLKRPEAERAVGRAKAQLGEGADLNALITLALRESAR